MILKIKRHNYEIDEQDEFMDNGACVQLLTQSKERGEWGRTPNPILSKRAIKEISVYERLQRSHNYTTDIQVFSLRMGM